MYSLDWEPFAMSLDFPLPMLRPMRLAFDQPIILDAESASFLAMGLGRRNMEDKWMWWWSSDGTLSFFRSWTGYELFRLRMTPVESVPGPVEWQAIDVWVESSRDRYSGDAAEAARLLLDLVRSAPESRDYLENVPRTREEALARTLPPNAPRRMATHLVAQQIRELLPATALSCRIEDRQWSIPAVVILVDARADGDSVRLEFDDGSRLWLHQCWRVHAADGYIVTDVGGILLWPSPSFVGRDDIAAMAVHSHSDIDDVRALRILSNRGGWRLLDPSIFRRTESIDDAVLDLRLGPAPVVGAHDGVVEVKREETSRGHAADTPEGLALEIARCPEIPVASEAKSHPCHRIVSVQADRAPGERQLPEAWAGDLSTAKLVFLSSNPSISEVGDATSGAFEEDYPKPDWPDDRIVDFMTRRFGPPSNRYPNWVVDGYFLRTDGSRSETLVAYWREAQRRATEIFGYEASPVGDYVMTEVVHCKSKREIGVQQAAGPCASRYLDRVLSLAPADLVVVVGSKARDRLKELELLPAAFGKRSSPPTEDATVQVLGGRERLLVYLPHLVSMEKGKTFHSRYGAEAVAVLRSVAMGEAAPNQIDWSGLYR